MRFRRSLALGVAVTGVFAGVLVTHAAGTTTAAACTTQDASTAATAADFMVDPGTGKTPVNTVICGPFLGAGSQAMAATVAVPTGCGFSIAWGVFRLEGGAWQLVMQQHNGVLKLESVPQADGGADVRTTQGYPRDGDVACSPSRLRTQVWHWNGATFAASPYSITSLLEGFWSPVKPARRLWCEMADTNQFQSVTCQFGYPGQRHAYRAVLKTTGTVTLCREGKHRRCVFCICDEGRSPTLAFGQHMDIARFRCASLPSGLRCTVIGSGKGFLVTPRRVSRIR